MGRLRDESGMGMLELLIAIVVLNIGLFALMGSLNAATVAMARAGSVSDAATVADGQMETYRSLRNCAIFLDATAATTTFPVKNSGTAYQADALAYTSNGVATSFFDKSLTPTQQALQPWATNYTDLSSTTWNNSIPASCPTSPTGVTSAISSIKGPDGHTYLVYTYMTLVQPPSGYYVKQVTIVVRDPTTMRVLARESSIFDPLVAK